MGRSRIVVGALVLCACGPAVILPGEGETSAEDTTANGPVTTDPGTTSPGTTSPGATDPGTTAPGTTAPGTTDPGTTVDPSDPDATTWWETDSDDTAGPTTTPTTAGDDGGVPGGAGPDASPDDDGDVMLPEADVLAAAVYTDGESLDFRVQLDSAPFGVEATYDITWCVATETGDGSCATHADNIGAYLQIFLVDGVEIEVDPYEVDACLYGAFETETNTMRMLVPIDLFPGHADFQWILTVTYGGSFGNNEWVPENGALDVIAVDEFPPFSGEATCD